MESNCQRGYKILRIFTDDKYHSISADKTYHIYQNLPRQKIKHIIITNTSTDVKSLYLRELWEWCKLTPTCRITTTSVTVPVNKGDRPGDVMHNAPCHMIKISSWGHLLLALQSPPVGSSGGQLCNQLHCSIFFFLKRQLSLSNWPMSQPCYQRQLPTNDWNKFWLNSSNSKCEPTDP